MKLSWGVLQECIPKYSCNTPQLSFIAKNSCCWRPLNEGQGQHTIMAYPPVFFCGWRVARFDTPWQSCRNSIRPPKTRFQSFRRPSYCFMYQKLVRMPQDFKGFYMSCYFCASLSIPFTSHLHSISGQLLHWIALTPKLFHLVSSSSCHPIWGANCSQLFGKGGACPCCSDSVSCWL